MAGSINRVELLGHLGRDPETRRTQGGDPVVSFSIATTESWRDKATGEMRDRTQWHNIVVFNEHLCKIAEQYLRKGSKAFVSGQLQHRDYEDRDGHKRRATEIVLTKFNGEIVLLGDPKARAGEDDYGTTRAREPRDDRSRVTSGIQNQYEAQKSGAARPRNADLDDDIPF